MAELKGFVCDFCGEKTNRRKPLKKEGGDIFFAYRVYRGSNQERFGVGLSIPAILHGLDGGGFGASYVDTRDLCVKCREKFMRSLLEEIVDPGNKIPILEKTLDDFKTLALRLQKNLTELTEDYAREIVQIKETLDETRAEIANHRLKHQLQEKKKTPKRRKTA